MTRNARRFRLNRAGIHQVWQYDDVFLFGDGRLLLRGKNGAGKSKALEMLLPFLLDGDSRRIDATGGGKTTLKWLMLDGWTAGTNRLGYLWTEFLRETEDGQREILTVGAAVKASTSTGEAKPVFFITDLAVGDELPLDDPARRPSIDRLRELVGPDNCYDRPADYRTRVAHDLFGLVDSARYHNLVHLLYGLRKPTIGDRVESGELVKVLSDALPPLNEEILDRVARNLDDLETVRTELARLEKTDTALTTFLTSYRGYLRGVLRGRVGVVKDVLEALRTRRRAAGDAERDLAALRATEQKSSDHLTMLEERRDNADTELRALHKGAAYRALKDLREKRRTVEAVATSARSAWTTAELARIGEAGEAERLSKEVETIGMDLSDLRGVLRDARRTARSCGIDESLLGETPAAQAHALPQSGPFELTDPEGTPVRIERTPTRRLAPETAGSLKAWQSRLEDAALVVKARRRATDVLRTKFREVAKAAATAQRAGDDVDRLEARVDSAQKREERRHVDLVATSQVFAEEVRKWSAGFPEPEALLELVRIPADEELPAIDRALPRDLAKVLRRLAHEIMAPLVEGHRDDRDRALSVERGLNSELASALAEKARWERERDPAPPRSSYATAERLLDTGAPFYLLVDFGPLQAPGGPEAGLEAALEASGLLSAWVCADGILINPDTRDVLVRSDLPVAGPSLADMLRPVPGHGVGAEALDRLLCGIGLGESAAHSWVAADGRWRLGVASGAYGKNEAEYIGAGRREVTRQRRITELTTLIEDLRTDLERAQEVRAAIESQLEALATTLRHAPNGSELTEDWARCEAAGQETSRLRTELQAARTVAGQTLKKAVELRTQAHAQATADGLPTDSGRLDDLQKELSDFTSGLRRLGTDITRCTARLSTHAENHAAWTRANTRRAESEDVCSSALKMLNSARLELELLTKTVGASEQEILNREQAVQATLRTLEGLLPRARTDRQDAYEQRFRAEIEQKETLLGLETQERKVVADGSGLRRPLGMPGLVLAAEIGDLDAALECFDTAQDHDVRARITALWTLAEDVETRLGSAHTDVSDSLILKRGEELRDGLSGGYDARSDERDGIKQFALEDDTGAHDVAVVGQRIRAAATAARDQLSVREQEVFERYLLGELGDHLSRQVLAAQALVKVMNSTLDEVRSSHGIGARLLWDLSSGNDADITAAVALLRKPAVLRDREQSERLRDALRRQIEEKRKADPSAGYAAHLRAALDYRAWFSFRVKVTDVANPDKERILSHRTALSQGEQRVVSYLVLFATAAAHFTSLGRGAPTAPRMILLDDAFAKVDEPTHGRLLGLLVDLDLDFVLTSERLFGCFPTVPSLHIYECLRDPHIRGVATVHIYWDGHRRHHLVGL